MSNEAQREGDKSIIISNIMIKHVWDFSQNPKTLQKFCESCLQYILSLEAIDTCSWLCSIKC